MKRWLFVVCALALIISGCMTTPPGKAVGSAMIPRITGPESGYTGTGNVGAHDWTDDQARTALWLRRNFPERWGEIPFPFLNLLRYNMHHDRQQYMAFEWDYYFANMRNPSLQVRMFTLEARDRNRARRNEAITKKATAKSAVKLPIRGEVSELSNAEVVKELETVFP
jgi:hypothetical protein